MSVQRQGLLRGRGARTTYIQYKRTDDEGGKKIDVRRIERWDAAASSFVCTILRRFDASLDASVTSRCHNTSDSRVRMLVSSIPRSRDDTDSRGVRIARITLRSRSTISLADPRTGSRPQATYRTSSSAIAGRPRDASCLLVVSFNVRRPQSCSISYFGFRFTTAHI